MEILGVCNRLSKKSGIDRGIIQFAFIFGIIFSGGSALILYVLAYFLID
jgi:hypothetical protein